MVPFFGFSSRDERQRQGQILHCVFYRGHVRIPCSGEPQCVLLCRDHPHSDKVSDFLLRTHGWSLSVCQELSSVLPHRGFQTRVWWQAGHVGCLTHHLMISFTLALGVKWELKPRSHHPFTRGMETRNCLRYRTQDRKQKGEG